MLWKTNFIEQSLNASSDSMPGDIQIKSINGKTREANLKQDDDDDADDENEVNYCADNSIQLNARRSDNYELSDGENPDK